MSMLTEVTLVIPSYVGVGFLTRVDDEISAGYGGLTRLDTEHAGGTKVYFGYVYAAVFNHITPEEVLDFVGALPWGYGPGYLIIDSEFYAEESNPQVFAFPGARRLS